MIVWCMVACYMLMLVVWLTWNDLKVYGLVALLAKNTSPSQSFSRFVLFSITNFCKTYNWSMSSRTNTSCYQGTYHNNQHPYTVGTVQSTCLHNFLYCQDSIDILMAVAKLYSLDRRQFFLSSHSSSHPWVVDLINRPKDRSYSLVCKIRRVICFDAIWRQMLS